MALGPIITEHELAVWAGKTDTEIAADPLAQQVLELGSSYFRFLAGDATWDHSNAPTDVRRLAIFVFRRTYVNLDQEKSSTTGPISSTSADDFARAMDLSETEMAVLTKYDGATAGTKGLWTMSITGNPEVTIKPLLFRPDNLQDPDIGFWIPLHSPGDPGDPNAYV